MSEATERTRRSVTESPWYWLYVFCAAGLVALTLMAPKFQARQTQIELQGHGRGRALQLAAGDTRTASKPLTDPTGQDTLISLRPLFFGLGGLFVMAWSVVWWQHFRVKPRRSDECESEVSRETVSELEPRN